MLLDTILEKCDNFSYFTPATENEISLSEEKLGITFPDDYRYFLLKYGVAELDTEEIFGLGCPATSSPNIIYIRKQIEQIDHCSYDGLVPIYTNGFGDYHFLVCTSNKKANFGNVITINGNDITIIAESFTAFIEQLIQSNS